MLYKFHTKRQLLHNKYDSQQLHNLLKKISLLFASFLFCVSSAYTQNFDVRFNHITSDNGLSQNTIEDILKDSRGFVWFATRNGLNRYDGYSFKVYKAGNSEHDLSSNFIHSICEDLEGNLWIGTENGLNIFDTKTNTFSVLFQNPEDTNSISDNNISDIVCDKNGIIWAGTYTQGLIRIQKTTNAKYIFKRYQYTPNEPTGILSNTIHTLFIDKENNLWIGTDNGINKLDNSTNSFEPYRNISDEINPLSHNSVSVIFEDSFGYIWIGTWNGLNQMNKATGEIKYFLFDTKNQSNSSNSAINTIDEDIEGNLLIGSINGLYKFVRKESRFYQFSVKSNNDYALSNELISCIETDSLGNVWIGTHMGGVNHYNVHQKKFKHIVIEPLPEETNNNNIINSIYTDPKTLWIGTAGSGLYCLDKLTGKYNHFKNIPGDLQSINGNYVSAIKKDNIGNLWIGTWESGLNRVHLNSKPIRFERISEKNGWNSMLNKSITSIHIDSSFVLIGGEYGLDKLITENKNITPVANNQNWTNNISQVRCILKDKQGFFWIGTRLGLYCFHESKLKTSLSDADITYYRSNADQPNSLPCNFIETLCEDHIGNIWAGTFGHGICQIQRKNNDEVIFRSFNEKDELSNNVIYSIQTDKNGDLWIGTDYGLSRFDITTKKFSNYYASDGLQSNQFFWGASTKGEDGTLYFGGTNGINYFVPIEIKDIDPMTNVTFTDFKLFNKSVNVGEEEHKKNILSKDISMASEVRLTYKEDIFSIEFSALTYFQPQKINYAYKLEGVDDEWIHTSSTQRFANYRNLDGGKYTFLVKASNSNGEWSQHPTKLDIIITPPFWDTLLFKIFGISLLAFFIAFYFRYRTRILIIQKQSLEEIVKNRTNEIALQKEQLTIQNKEITAQHNELMDLNKKVQHVNQLKLRFFTNISHEFRTPLTLIAGPVKKLLTTNPEPDETKKSLQIIDRNVQRLIHLINQLLDFRKVETNKLELKVSRGDLLSFINEICTSFEQLAQEKQINFTFTHEQINDDQWFDYEKLENILFNLLSNAFKHTPANGEISISLKVNSNSKIADLNMQASTVIIKVVDTGIGIPAEHLGNIFKRFYQIDTPENIKNRGSGIGLSLTKDLVIAHHGTIHVKSEVGKGSTFTVIIPFQKESFSSNEISDETMIWDNSGLKHKMDSSELSVETNTKKNTSTKNTLKSTDKPTILIVEDNFDLREFVINSLIYNYNILEAENGKTAYEIAKVQNPELIISDIMMPVMDGLELCTRIKNNLLTSHIPVILLTARSLVENWIEGLESGADDYVPKPFDLDLLKAKIKNLLESREKLRKHFSGDVSISSSEITTTKADSDFINKAFEIVEENYTNPEFGVKELVDKMNVSHSLLHKKLKVIVNKSAGDFITIIRLKRAAELLNNSAKNISEVAYEVGFNDPKYFSQKFKRYFGILPSNYIKNK